jgi:P4 family phage/plasmid primase-like protien
MTSTYELVLDDIPLRESDECTMIIPLRRFDPDVFVTTTDLTSFTTITINARSGTLSHAHEVADRFRELAPDVPVEVTLLDLPNLNGDRAGEDHGSLAQLFYAQHGEEVRWLRDMERWLVWEDGRWQGVTDRTGQQLVRGRLLVTLYNHGLVHARKIYQNMKRATGDNAKAHVAAAVYEERMRSAPMQNSVWQVVSAMAGRSSVRTSVDQLNADAWLLNCADRMVDLRTGLPVPHDPRKLCTENTNVLYDPDAEAPTFLRFLSEALPDPEIRAFVQRRAGSFLVGAQREHVLHVDLGESGRNGKSTFGDALRTAMGSYAVVTDARILLVSQTDRHETEKARLVSKRLVLVEEARSTRMLDAATTKNLTGNVRRSARFMRMDSFEYQPTDSWLLVTNELPRFRGSDEALGARLMIVPWSQSFLGREDVELLSKIREEAEGVLRWMVEGAVAYCKEGLAPPAVVTGTTDAERREHDPLSDWFEDRLSPATDPADFAHVAKMYAECRELFKVRGVLDDVPSYIDFGRQLARFIRQQSWSTEWKQRSDPTYGKSAAWIGVHYSSTTWIPDASWIRSLHT